jgi:hypothetical protein
MNSPRLQQRNLNYIITAGQAIYPCADGTEPCTDVAKLDKNGMNRSVFTDYVVRMRFARGFCPTRA